MQNGFWQRYYFIPKVMMATIILLVGGYTFLEISTLHTLGSYEISADRRIILTESDVVAWHSLMNHFTYFMFCLGVLIAVGITYFICMEYEIKYRHQS